MLCEQERVYILLGSDLGSAIGPAERAREWEGPGFSPLVIQRTMIHTGGGAYLYEDRAQDSSSGIGMLGTHEASMTLKILPLIQDLD